MLLRAASFAVAWVLLGGAQNGAMSATYPQGTCALNSSSACPLPKWPPTYNLTKSTIMYQVREMCAHHPRTCRSFQHAPAPEGTFMRACDSASTATRGHGVHVGSHMSATTCETLQELQRVRSLLMNSETFSILLCNCRFWSKSTHENNERASTVHHLIPLPALAQSRLLSTAILRSMSL